MKTTRFLPALAALLAALSGAYGQQNVFSRSDSGTNLWDNGANLPWFFSGGPPSGNQSRPDNGPSFPTRNDVFFGHNNNLTQDINSTVWFQLRNLTIQSTASSSRTWNSSGGAGISLSAGFTNDAGAGAQTFNNQFGIDSSSVSFTNNGGNVTMTSNVFVNSNSLIFGGSGNFAVSGNVSGSGGSVSKIGTGRLILSGPNVYSGGTFLNAGTLVVASNSALGAPTGAVSFSGSANATLRYNAGVTTSNNVTVTNPGSGSSIQIVTGNNTAFRTGTTGSLRSNLATGTRPNTGYAFLAGNNTTGEQTVQLAFRDISAAVNDSVRLSEIIGITGMGNVSGSQKNTFVLQLNLASLASDAFLGWLNGSNTWVNATAGNFGSGSLAGFYGTSFTTFVANNGGVFNATTMLGAWGRDTANGNVWAVVNHNSDFAVIPEPGTCALFAIGSAFILWRRRRA
jgi:autotransporter-associated beta strand protein